MTDERSTSSVEVLSRIGDYLDSYVSIADAKAGAVSGASGALLLFVASRFPEPSPLLFPLLVSITATVAAFLVSLSSLYPRSPSAGTSLIAWRDVAKNHRSVGDFVLAFQTATTADLAAQMIEQNYWLSIVLARKFLLLRISLWLLGLGVLSLALGVGVQR
jgi:hypothetical protein